MGIVPISPSPDLAAERHAGIGFAVDVGRRYLVEQIVEVVVRRRRRDHQLADLDGEAVAPLADSGLHGYWGSGSGRR